MCFRPVLLVWLLGSVCRGDEMSAPRVWDTCSYVEGNGAVCRIHNPPRPFGQFLQPERMAADQHSEFAGQLSWLLHEHPKTSVKWDELGKLGGHRVRRIEYSSVQATGAEAEKFAGFVVIERSLGIFAPLLQWCGRPLPVGETNVLDTGKDFGGNIPMVITWAWVWTPQGPIRLEVEKAVQEAIQKVAPGHAGYDTGIDWPSLHTQTYSWGPGGYPGKLGVTEVVNAWFELRGTRLVVTRAEWEDRAADNVIVKRWP
jgi:hypothetical protein